MHPYAAYWDKGVANVPDMTGAKHLLDARDLKAIFAQVDLPVPFVGTLVDVGCGTGRMAQLCADASQYVGLDISPSMVEYCRQAGLTAHLMDGAPWSVFDVKLITCISVFTHIGRAERVKYLLAFRRAAPKVLVDIIPGDGSGHVALWTAKPDEFVSDVERSGFRVAGDVTQAWDMHTHRYFLLERN